MAHVKSPLLKAPSAIQRYGLALLSVLVALGLALLLQNYGIRNLELPLFLAAITITVWNVGFGPGILVLVASSLAFNYFFTQPLYTFYIDSADRPYFVSFVLFGSMIAWFALRRRRIEQALLEAREGLEKEVAERTQQASLLNLTHDTIFVRDMNDVITYWNRGAQELYGWTPEQAIGRRSDQLLQTAFPLPIDDIRSELMRTGRWEGELETKKADGAPVVVASRWSLRKDDQDRAAAILETNNDVTERKQTEIKIYKLNADLEKRSMQLEGSNKELEAFAYTISHDLRAPLRHMVGYAELLQSHASSSLDEKGSEYMSAILDSAKRMGNLIDDLLAFSRIGRAETQKSLVNMELLLKEVLSEIRQETDGRNIVWSIGALPHLYGDRSMLRLALVNLLSNAVKFTSTRVQAEIQIGCTDGRENEVIVFIKDNGVGFNMKYVGKLFGVFQRLHRREAFEGTGIGLATVQRIINRHGGRVWAEGEKDKGATFYFSAPKP